MISIDEINKLKEENTRLKEEIYIAKENYGLVNEYQKMYKQALQEIKGIAETSTSVPCLEPNCDCENCEDECTDNGKTCMQYGLEKIKDKISEVLDEQ